VKEERKDFKMTEKIRARQLKKMLRSYFKAKVKSKKRRKEITAERKVSW
jgi:hypothetical protein